MENILHMLPLFVAPVVVLGFTMISAYVLRFAVKRSGIAFDYILLTIAVVCALGFGGAI